MRVLVTGGAGFIGSHLCDRLIAEGCEVLALDNLSTGSRANLAHLDGHPRLRFVEHDVCDPLELPERFDQIYNLASPASPKDYHAAPVETLMTGAAGTRNLLEIACKDSAVFVLASTSECYGDPLVHPQPETYWGNVNPVGPRSVYDEAKRFAEALTMAFHRARGADTRIVRLFNTYGPRMKGDDGRVVPAFLEQALRGEPLTVFGDGTQTRSFCYVADIVEGLVRLASSSESGPVNLGNPDEMTMLELAAIVHGLTGTDTGIRFDPLPEEDPKRRRPDIAKARRVLDWRPEVSLDDGMRATLEFFRQANQESVAQPSR